MDYSRVIAEIFSQFTGPKFLIKLWNGKVYEYGSGKTASFTLVINDENTARRLLAQGSLGFGESYMEGKLDIEGDIEAYLKMRHQFKRVRKSIRLAFATFLAKRSMPKDRKNQIAYHYDIGNDFFQMLLDPQTMSYSAGLYETASEDLGVAQERKIKFLASWLNLKENSSVLDLGCGWGGFAAYAAEVYKWSITGYSLSNEQLDYCHKFISEKGLDKKVKLEYRDMLEKLPPATYDGIIMLESIEHVGQDRLKPFFAELFKALKPNGHLVLQLTGRYASKRVDKWTLKYVFPGGYLPAKDELMQAAEEAGFVCEDFRDDTPDYIKTMSVWIKNLEANKEKIEKKFGSSFYRLWYLWMHGAKVNFETNSMNLFRVKIKKPNKF